MMVKCLDGPCAGESHPVPDDARIGHMVQRALPFEAIRADEPVYHPWSDQARNRILQKFATYIYTAGGLKHVTAKKDDAA